MYKTEARNPKTTHIDKMTTLEMLKVINEENQRVIYAVEKQLDNIARAVDVIEEALNKNGRLFYVGAGTSGRLGVLDAAECPPTFGVDRGVVNAIIAGGEKCMTRASENEEDNPQAGIDDLMAFGITKDDVVVGISASGGAAYVVAALEKAKETGCVTIGVTSNEGSALDRVSDISICTDTGPEVITGSTRMKAGTAQKLVLNMLSTCAMIKTGKVYENLMINLKPSNRKLKKRMINIVTELTGYDEGMAAQKLNEFDWDIRKAMEDYNK